MNHGIQSQIRIALRTDASLQIGTGHVMRCLALADALRERGADCLFICRPHRGHLLDLIAQRGHKAVTLPARTEEPPQPLSDSAHAGWLGTDWATDAEDTRHALGTEAVDWLVVDHYALDRLWEHALRPYCNRLMIIDDLADRPHDCDLLLDQNLGRTDADYSGLLPANTPTLIGPQYALLRPEFAQLRAESLARRTNPQLKHLLITMGGVDKDNATGRVLDTLSRCVLPPDLSITVVMGQRAPWLEHVQTQAAQMNCPTRVLVGVTDMARLMTESDLAVGAAGGTAWERCCLGLASIVLVLADNQQSGAEALQATGAALAMQNASEIQNLFQAHTLCRSMPKLLQQMSKAAVQVTDGLGVLRTAQRLVANHGWN